MCRPSQFVLPAPRLNKSDDYYIPNSSTTKTSSVCSEVYMNLSLVLQQSERSAVYQRSCRPQTQTWTGGPYLLLKAQPRYTCCEEHDASYGTVCRTHLGGKTCYHYSRSIRKDLRASNHANPEVEKLLYSDLRRKCTKLWLQIPPFLVNRNLTHRSARR